MNPTNEPEEITAELRAEDLAQPDFEPPPLTAVAAISLGARTDLGRARENNEDKFDFLVPEDAPTAAARGAVYAVADGMGGHKAGQIASELGLKTFLRAYFGDLRAPVEAALRTAVQRANEIVWETGRHVASRTGMGSTLTAAVVLGDGLWLTQLGDSRAYRLRDGVLEQLTQDHSYVQEQVRAGILTPEEAAVHPQRNIITRSLGAEPVADPDVTRHELAEGDHYLLCSDGLSGVLAPEELASALRDRSPSVAALELVERANERGGPDNITAVILRVDRITRIEEP